MKLSEAIRLGSMVSEQAFYVLRAGGRTCALGAAYAAVGIQMPESVDSQADMSSEFNTAVSQAFPILDVLAEDGRPLLQCPDCQVTAVCVGSVVVHLNDNHHWTREAIADWVETVEAAEELRPIVAPVQA